MFIIVKVYLQQIHLNSLIRDNQPSLLVSPLDGIQCLHRADRSPLENITYEFVLICLTLEVCKMGGEWSYGELFPELCSYVLLGRFARVVLQLLFYGELFPGFVQCSIFI